ncbi:MAG: hypothetical protein DPW18_17105 [Chloroflexi bacterium]|nr:hypothetical protein [Chloroflexota bacterium]MDL1941694.1 hypothetical protein [Chloroflexi bacterium CFX2]
MQTKHREYPLHLLLILFLAVGLFTFRDYGLSWDEPLYYEYGKASQYAYSIQARLEGTFDLEKSFGSSPGDHVTRGPAYLLIGGLVEGVLEAFGLDMASAWHLTNFLTYLLGLGFFYALTRLWLDPIPAALSTAFFATQPVLWNHAFINPKDNPFAVLFLAAMLLGFRMVDAWQDDNKAVFKSAILPGAVLGIATATRFIAPYAAALLFIYFLATQKWTRMWGFIPYGATAVLVMTALWPFLWENPVERFLFTLQAMADIPANLKILFLGETYPAYDLPRRYFPTLFAITFTEPTWLLFAAGLFASFRKYLKQKADIAKLTVILLWFGILLGLLVGLNPPNSDGYRHYLFIIPPVFLFAGFGIHEILKRIRSLPVNAAILAVIFLPAVYNNITLHPYQYAYYNTFAGGTKSAFREYETDYWLTCYREAVLAFNEIAPDGAQLFVRREPYIAAYYASPKIVIRDFRAEQKDMQTGDYYLANSRANEDLKFLRGEPAVVEVARQGAVFCVIKQVP